MMTTLVGVLLLAGATSGDRVPPEVAVAIAVAQLTQPTTPASSTKTGVVLWRFTSSNCGPCRGMEPIIARLRKRGYRIVDKDAMDPATWKEINVQPGAIPFFFLWIDGVPWQMWRATPTEEQLTAWLEEAKEIAKE